MRSRRDFPKIAKSILEFINGKQIVKFAIFGPHWILMRQLLLKFIKITSNKKHKIKQICKARKSNQIFYRLKFAGYMAKIFKLKSLCLCKLSER